MSYMTQHRLLRSCTVSISTNVIVIRDRGPTERYIAYLTNRDTIALIAHTIISRQEDG